MEDSPMVSIVIAHYLDDILSECLEAIYERTEGVSFEVIVADDQPYDDGSLGRALERFPDIRIVETGGGNGAPCRGMAAGYNRGLEVARGRYAMLMNNDIEVSSGWLLALVAAAEADEGIGACQPKVLSVRERNRFDEGGAAGGLMDLLGYPFCLGRVFDTVEEDRGQYDCSRDIFWALGGAVFIRMSCLEKTGLMDEAFYMHMEEIDFCWRLHLAGFRVVSAPRSVVYHYGGWSLETERFQRVYLKQRNNLVMVLKNWSAIRLLWIFPARVCLELCTLLAVFKGDWKHPTAALGGLLWVVAHPLNILRRRRKAQRFRTVSDREVAAKMYSGSVVFQYFVKGIRTAANLPGEGVVGQGGAG